VARKTEAEHLTKPEHFEFGCGLRWQFNYSRIAPVKLDSMVSVRPALRVQRFQSFQRATNY